MVKEWRVKTTDDFVSSHSDLNFNLNQLILENVFFIIKLNLVFINKTAYFVKEKEP